MKQSDWVAVIIWHGGEKPATIRNVGDHSSLSPHERVKDLKTIL